MLTNATQRTRDIAVFTPLGEDYLLLKRITGDLRLSHPFEIELQLLSQHGGIDPTGLIGEPVSMVVDQQDTPIYYHGIVSRFRYAGKNDLGSRYTATVRPWFWFLRYTTDCRIFQNKTVPEILEEVLGEAPNNDFDVSKLTGSYESLEYCVQYRESDFDFCSRLMEEYGIFYFFEHSEGGHKLVLADSVAAYVPIPEGKVTVKDPENPEELEFQITRWIHDFEFKPGAWAQRDYNFESPSTDMLADESTKMKWKNVDQFEVYDYPGRYPGKSKGMRLTQVRMEEEEAQHDSVHGQGSYRTFFPSRTFKVGKHHDKSEEGKEFVVTTVRVMADVGDSYSTEEMDDGYQYENEFVGIPTEVVFRPNRETPRPIVEGPQTAMVVGPAGKELYVDEYARVKVQFHWDRYGKKDENSSCWIRVSQPWAGSGFGGMNIPRISQEVIVSFLEGDPDRPIISGRVYNAESMPYPSNAGRNVSKSSGEAKYPDNQPPKDIPAADMMSSFKSNSLGGSGGHNEITMNDTGGDEGLFFRAEKDEVHTVGNDRTDNVGNDEDRKVGNNRTRVVGVDETVEIGNNQEVTIGNDRDNSIGANHTESIGANHDESIGANHTQTVGGIQSIAVAGESGSAIGGNKSTTVGGSESRSIGSSRQTDVGGSDNVTVAMISNLSAGLIASIEAGAQVVLQGPGGTITIGPSGIHIKGKEVKIEGDVVLINP